MRKILNLPQGGGGDHGRDVWFRLVVEGEPEQDFSIHHQQVENLVRGLRHFAQEAAKLRQANGLEASEPPAPTPVERIECHAQVEGGLDLTLHLPQGERVAVAVSRPLVKRLLLGALTAMAPATASAA